MDTKHLAKLLDRYMNKESSQEEILELFKYINDPENEHIVKELLGDMLNSKEPDDNLQIHDQQLILDEIFERGKQPVQQGRRVKLWYRITAAASVLLLFAIGSYFVLHKKQSVPKIAKNPTHDIAPGGYKATLTLSNGAQISLSDAKNGVIAKENKEIIKKAADGTIVYQDNSSANNDGNSPLYNTITTPKGGQWPVVLPDGSRVILNAASALRYPVTFTTNERRVELSGEAYFEVAHNAAKPFRVISNGQTVEVLGTHFNINAYGDEPVMTTTLLEGSVRLRKDNTTVMIKPGEEATWANGGDQFKVKQADPDAAVAWKNGLFQFDHTSIEAVMRQAARWYDVEISYKGNIPQVTFTGNLPRNVNASRLLEMLSITGVHFNIEGKKIIVTP